MKKIFTILTISIIAIMGFVSPNPSMAYFTSTPITYSFTSGDVLTVTEWEDIDYSWRHSLSVTLDYNSNTYDLDEEESVFPYDVYISENVDYTNGYTINYNANTTTITLLFDNAEIVGATFDIILEANNTLDDYYTFEDNIYKKQDTIFASIPSFDFSSDNVEIDEFLDITDYFRNMWFGEPYLHETILNVIRDTSNNEILFA